MNVLIVGKGPNNDEINSYFEESGHFVFETKAANVVGLSGYVGDFSIRLKNGFSEADIVILAEVPGASSLCIDGGNVNSVYAEDKMSLLPKKDNLNPVVFLLDYFDESSIAAHIAALKDSKMLANQKRKTYYISRFVRTACPGGEKLYREARNAGVTFIKFEEINLSYDSDNDDFIIKVSDGVLSNEINTKTIFTEDGSSVGETFEKVTRALRISTDENGYINEDRHFLATALTSRRGVYHINRNVAINGIKEALDSIVSDVAAIEYEATSKAALEDDIVIVDGEKCVFCYTCYRACPHAAMEANLNNRVMDNLPIACHGCGICVSVCPGNALSLSQTDILPIGEKKDKILVMCCENSAEVAIKEALPTLGEDAGLINIKSISCGGQIGMEDLSEALTGYGKVMIAVCMDDACKHFEGNKRACAQSNRLKEMLEKAGMAADRIGCVKVSPVMPGVLKEEIQAFMKGDLA